MATKPTSSTEWATDTGGTALKTETTLQHKQYGWGIVNGIGDVPNLNEVNYWRFSVHEWLQYLDLARDEGTTAISDLNTRIDGLTSPDVGYLFSNEATSNVYNVGLNTFTNNIGTTSTEVTDDGTSTTVASSTNYQYSGVLSNSNPNNTNDNMISSAAKLTGINQDDDALHYFTSISLVEDVSDNFNSRFKVSCEGSGASFKVNVCSYNANTGNYEDTVTINPESTSLEIRARNSIFYSENYAVIDVLDMTNSVRRFIVYHHPTGRIYWLGQDPSSNPVVWFSTSSMQILETPLGAYLFYTGNDISIDDYLRAVRVDFNTDDSTKLDLVPLAQVLTVREPVDGGYAGYIRPAVCKYIPSLGTIRCVVTTCHSHTTTRYGATKSLQLTLQAFDFNTEEFTEIDLPFNDVKGTKYTVSIDEGLPTNTGTIISFGEDVRAVCADIQESSVKLMYGFVWGSDENNSVAPSAPINSTFVSVDYTLTDPVNNIWVAALDVKDSIRPTKVLHPSLPSGEDVLTGITGIVAEKNDGAGLYELALSYSCGAVDPAVSTDLHLGESFNLSTSSIVAIPDSSIYSKAQVPELDAKLKDLSNTASTFTDLLDYTAVVHKRYGTLIYNCTSQSRNAARSAQMPLEIYRNGFFLYFKSNNVPIYGDQTGTITPPGYPDWEATVRALYNLSYSTGVVSVISTPLYTVVQQRLNNVNNGPLPVSAVLNPVDQDLYGYGACAFLKGEDFETQYSYTFSTIPFLQYDAFVEGIQTVQAALDDLYGQITGINRLQAFGGNTVSSDFDNYVLSLVTPRRHTESGLVLAASTPTNINHNLDQKVVQIAVYNESNDQLVDVDVILIDANNLTITASSTITVSVVVLK